MHRSRWTIAGLMAVVMGVAIGFAALKSPSETWAGVIAAGALVALVGAVLGVSFRRGPARAFWTGFALAGWSYAFVCLLPGVFVIAEPWLPTTAFLDRLHPLFCEPQIERTRLLRDHFDEAYSEWSQTHPLAQGVQVNYDERDSDHLALVWETPTLWLFRRIGHGLFTLIFAVLGGLLARALALLIGRASART